METIVFLFCSPNYRKSVLKLLLLPMLFFQNPLIKAQDLAISRPDSFPSKNMLAIQLPEVLHMGLELNYQRFITKKNTRAVSLSAGIKPGGVPVNEGGSGSLSIYDDNGDFDIKERYPRFLATKSYYVALGIKQYVVKRFYCEIDAFVRLSSLEGTTFTWGYGGRNFSNQYTKQLDLNAQDVGGKFLVGYSLIAKKLHKRGVVLDVYAGLGIRNRNVDVYVYKYEVTYGNSVVEKKYNYAESFSGVIGSPQLGCRMGFRF